MGVIQRGGVLLKAAPWLLPAGLSKNKLLQRMGNKIDDSAHIGPCLVMRVGSVEVGPNAYLGGASVFKDIDKVSLKKDAAVGGFNLVSAHPVFAQRFRSAGGLYLEEGAVITSRHSLDCSGDVRLGRFSLLAGHGTQVLSHSIDLERNAQSARPVVVGERSFVGSRCLLLGGSEVPANSVVAAGSVVTGSGFEEGSLMAGVPAKVKRPITGKWFTRQVGDTNDVYDPESDRTIPQAF